MINRNLLFVKYVWKWSLRLSCIEKKNEYKYIDVKDEYINKLKDHRILFFQGVKEHNSLKKSDNIINTNTKLFKRLNSEFKKLQCDLPLFRDSSIFLVVDEDYPQFMKALLTGPKDTPYQNGVFLFDIYIPDSYPSRPPKVLIANNGGIRFNPNLYNEGKVCLSLLGTWTGPGWDPDNSSIFQVLVSIQSLIMVSNPYNNEPGFEETKADDPSSLAYSRNVYGATVSHAIIKASQNPYKFFENIIRTHFSLKKEEIYDQIVEYANKLKPDRDLHKMVDMRGGIKTSKSGLLSYAEKWILLS